MASQKRIFQRIQQPFSVKRNNSFPHPSIRHINMYAWIWAYMYCYRYASKVSHTSLRLPLQRLWHPVHLPTPILNHQIEWGTLFNRISIKSSLSFLNRVNAETKRHSKQQKLSARRHAREHQLELRMRSTTWNEVWTRYTTSTARTVSYRNYPNPMEPLPLIVTRTTCNGVNILPNQPSPHFFLFYPLPQIYTHSI